MDIRGAVHFPLDCHLSPNRLMASLESALEARDCRFLWDTECMSLETGRKQIHAMRTSRGEVEGEEYMICGGAWSSQIAQASRDQASPASGQRIQPDARSSPSITEYLFDSDRGKDCRDPDGHFASVWRHHGNRWHG